MLHSRASNGGISAGRAVSAPPAIGGASSSSVASAPLLARGASAPPSMGSERPAVKYCNTSVQTSPPGDSSAFIEIHGEKPTREDLERKMGLAGIGRYKNPSDTLHGVEHSTVFPVLPTGHKPTYVHSAFQILKPQALKLALAKAKAKASLTANKFKSVAAKQKYKIWSESCDEKLEHSEQFPFDVKFDNAGKVTTDGDLTGRFVPNLYKKKIGVKRKHPKTAQASPPSSIRNATSLSSSSPSRTPESMPQAIPALEPSLREIVDDPADIDKSSDTWDTEHEASPYATDINAYVVYDASQNRSQPKVVQELAPLGLSLKRKDSSHITDGGKQTHKRSKTESSQEKAPVTSKTEGTRDENIETRGKTQARDLSRTAQTSRAQSSSMRNEHGSTRDKNENPRDTAELRDDPPRRRRRSRSPVRDDSSSLRQPSGFRDRNDSRPTRRRSRSPLGRDASNDTRAQHAKEDQDGKKRVTQSSKAEMKGEQPLLSRTPEVKELRVRGAADDRTEPAEYTVPTTQHAKDLRIRGAAENSTDSTGHTTLNSTPATSHRSTPVSTTHNGTVGGDGKTGTKARSANTVINVQRTREVAHKRDEKRSFEDAHPTNSVDQGQQAKRVKATPKVTQKGDSKTNNEAKRKEDTKKLPPRKEDVERQKEIDRAEQKKREIKAKIAERHANRGPRTEMPRYVPRPMRRDNEGNQSNTTTTTNKTGGQANGREQNRRRR
jgi:hypothetical protein